MANRIDLDHARFRGIVRGAIRRDLRKHIANGALTARQGAKTVKIPVPQIELPRFRFGSNDDDGVGQGDGQPGDPVDGEGESGAEILIVHESLLEVTALARPHPPELKTLVVIGEAQDGAENLDSLIASGDPAPLGIEINPREDVAALPYSSGTTGLSRVSC